ncbi:hypothetical protein M9Y10_035532 [Tritrichomonas musculus]|uniref:Uncharacterized protein n=1 Tax=Tritrichomonas musculus TaxID=1915356 RepID=A0ABR2KJX5_9EUKA
MIDLKQIFTDVSEFKKTFAANLSRNHEANTNNNIILQLITPAFEDQEKKIIVQSLSYIFLSKFYDQKRGTFTNFNDDIPFLTNPHFFLCTSFISFSEKISDTEKANILQTITSDQEQTYLNYLNKELSPYLFINFVHNLIHYVSYSTSDVEHEMIRQLITNSKELTLLPSFKDLYENLLNKIKKKFELSHKTFSDDEKHNFSYFFLESFFQTIHFSSKDYDNYNFDKFKCEFVKDLQVTDFMHFSHSSNSALFYYTDLFLKSSWIKNGKNCLLPYKGEQKENFKNDSLSQFSELRNKVVQKMSKGNETQIGNSLVTINFDSKTINFKQLTISFTYNQKYMLNAHSDIFEVVFPCFENIPLTIDIYYIKNRKKITLISGFTIPLNIATTKLVDLTNKSVVLSFTISIHYYNNDILVSNFAKPFDTDISKILDYVIQSFLKQYLLMNSYTVNENEISYERNTFFEIPNKDRIFQNISHRQFPDHHWIFLCDFIFRNSIPMTYFFLKFLEKLDQYWSDSQSYMDLCCVVFFNFYYCIKKFNHTEKDESYFELISSSLVKKCKKSLIDQFSKPENYQKLSITSILLILLLVNNDKQDENLLLSLYDSSIFHISKSILSVIQYVECEEEMDEKSFQLFTSCSQYNQYNYNFKIGPNNRPCCLVDMQSLCTALEILSYRCKSISHYYMESFFPGFQHYGKEVYDLFRDLALNLHGTFANYPNPSPNAIIYFMTTFSDLAKKYCATLEPFRLFNDTIEKFIAFFSKEANNNVLKLIKNDNFVKIGDNKRISCSLIFLFDHFNYIFQFIDNLGFSEDNALNYHSHIISLNSSYCRHYVDILFSIVSNKFRDKPFLTLPSWINEITDKNFLSFQLKTEEIAVISNNLFHINKKWPEYLKKFKKYNIEEYSKNHQKESQQFEIDPFANSKKKIVQKISSMRSFIKLELSYNIVDILNGKIWEGKNIRDTFFKEGSMYEKVNLTGAYKEILELLKSTFSKVYENLIRSYHLECLKQLIQGYEEGVCECLIPFIEKKIKNKSNDQLDILINKIKYWINDILGIVAEVFDSKEIEVWKDECLNVIHLIPFIEKHINDPKEEMENELKNQKDKSTISLLNIMIQATEKLSIFNTKRYTLISFE